MGTSLIQGRCHCGALGWVLETACRSLPRRHCGCGFCQRHAPVWTSDPDGRVRIIGGDSAIAYRFGHRTADFLVCSRCGVLVAAVDDEQPRCAVLNLRCAPDIGEDGPPPEAFDYDAEDAGARRRRHRGRWTPVVAEPDRSDSRP